MKHFKSKLFFFSFLFLIGYALCSLGYKFLDYKNQKNIPDEFFLQTQHVMSPFKKTQNGSYCLQQLACGVIKNPQKENFDFVLLNSLSTTFMSTNDSQIFKTKSVYFPQNVKGINHSTVTFSYQKQGKMNTITCSLNEEFCSINNKKSSLSLIGGGLKVNKNSSFDMQYHLKSSQHLFFKNKSNKIFTLKKGKNNIYQIVTPPQKNLKKEAKFLLLLSSYIRPIYLINQIHNLIQQKYTNFDIAISLKGVSKNIVHSLILPSIQSLQNKNRIIFQEHTNSHQFKNLLNTFRDINLSSYDYLCKIDDDDWYSSDYLNTVNLTLNILNKPPFIVSNDLVQLENKKDQLFLKMKTEGNMGSTICFNTEFAKELLRIEQLKDDKISTLIPSDTNLTPPYFNNFEDRLINALAHFRGDKAIYFSFKPLFIYNKQTPSITRFK